ncbi:hypothetical protein N7468_009554 [Penicillium chermesinum]|uniref:Uncharacterized protein n=1 Tax=Penicillium chermesinum TaxID=63820 RepID=A0A9W9NI11_9EURO|nr:uncharacterized protein N7468_009554 [Penicillium chermesinum]KAJ5220350.1 hypothetical protein N7468_009554 [Penicillium chermesinum]
MRGFSSYGLLSRKMRRGCRRSGRAIDSETPPLENFRRYEIWILKTSGTDDNKTCPVPLPEKYVAQCHLPDITGVYVHGRSTADLTQCLSLFAYLSLPKST